MVRLGDLHCRILAAALFLLSDVLEVVFAAMEKRNNCSDSEGYYALEVDDVGCMWMARWEHSGIVITFSIVKAAAWIIFLIPLMKFVVIQSNMGVTEIGLHYTLLVLSFFGAFSEFLAGVFQVGSFKSVTWFLENFEVVFVSLNGLVIWIDLMEQLIFAVILAHVFVSVRKIGNFSKLWAKFSLVFMLVSFIDFFLSLFNFEFWSMATVTIGISVVNRIVFMPIWLVWLARELPRVQQETNKKPSYITESSTLS